MPTARSDSAKRVVTSRSASPTATISAELAAPYEWPPWVYSPSKRTAAASHSVRTRATLAGSCGSQPSRWYPQSTPSTTRSGLRSSSVRASRAETWSAWSTITVNRSSLECSARTSSTLSGVSGTAYRMSSKPPSARKDASASVDTVMRRRSPSVAISAASSVLTVLKCGRRATPSAAARSRIVTAFFSSVARQQMRQGVRRSSTRLAARVERQAVRPPSTVTLRWRRNIFASAVSSSSRSSSSHR
mmetsp:Transcript_12068/g.38467  ORF Transcript_12068/g.38467 Transcript_12068/m.38467 type:complete len:246 (+) Transcript_12068:672-1409(+)